MPFEKGHNLSTGRPKGSPNKVTQEVRDAYQMLTEKKINDFENWIDRVAEKNPAKAMELILAMSEYFLPKLQRTEMSHEGEVNISPPTINFTKADES